MTAGGPSRKSRPPTPFWMTLRFAAILTTCRDITSVASCLAFFRCPKLTGDARQAAATDRRAHGSRCCSIRKAVPLCAGRIELVTAGCREDRDVATARTPPGIGLHINPTSGRMVEEPLDSEIRVVAKVPSSGLEEWRERRADATTAEEVR
jgi:hypothetical protein